MSSIAKDMQIRIAVSSLFELQAELEISRHLQFLSKDNYTALTRQTNEIERMLRSLINKLVG
jgi:four helix bundle protein